MREYLYMWINECVLLDDFGGAGYMIHEQGFSLSSKYRIKNALNNKTLFFKCEPTSVPNNFFSSDFSDIKVFVGENGSGKSTALKILYKIIGEGYLKVGDRFYIHVLNEVLEYKIDDVSVVEPDEVSHLNVISGKDCVTLVTCTPYEYSKIHYFEY